MAIDRKEEARYGFIIQWSDEDAGYIARCPDFPGVSAFGETGAEAIVEIIVAVRLAIETYQAAGWSLPSPRNLLAGPLVRLP